MSPSFLASNVQPGAAVPGFFTRDELAFMARRQVFRKLALGAALALVAGGAAWGDDKGHPPLTLEAQVVPATPAASVASASAPEAKPLDINTASRAQLKTLPGIGDAEAAKIIAARPYMTKTGLVEKQVLTLEAYDALRNRIFVVHKRAPAKPKG